MRQIFVGRLRRNEDMYKCQVAGEDGEQVIGIWARC